MKRIKDLKDNPLLLFVTFNFLRKAAYYAKHP